MRRELALHGRCGIDDVERPSWRCRTTGMSRHATALSPRRTTTTTPNRIPTALLAMSITSTLMLRRITLIGTTCIRTTITEKRTILPLCMLPTRL